MKRDSGVINTGNRNHLTKLTILSSLSSSLFFTRTIRTIRLESPLGKENKSSASQLSRSTDRTGKSRRSRSPLSLQQSITRRSIYCSIFVQCDTNDLVLNRRFNGPRRHLQFPRGFDSELITTNRGEGGRDGKR